MSIIVRVPGSLKKWFEGKDEAVCRGETIGECFEHLNQEFPGIGDRLVNREDGISANLVFLNGENIRYLDGLATPVQEEDEISIIPLAAGG
ncbi:MAG: MoaD/ThiS family protein [Proteobacteria bacterium]|nr:MoaD/ThiS family protein [Pseudomonadota bacterium]